MKKLSQGAEAIIYEKRVDNSLVIVKHRIKKDYRIEEIDYKLRKYRTRREARILEKLYALGFPSPKVLEVNEEEGIIVMEKIDGEKLRDVLDENNFKSFCYEIGKLVGFLHKHNIVHGDLTTSNFIVGKNNKLFLIDFGLSFISQKIEDKAVDLHLLRQALESKHFEFWQEAFKTVISSYKKSCPNAYEVLHRLEKVEQRGRYKRKKK